jgi:hypothetical protein
MDLFQFHDVIIVHVTIDDLTCAMHYVHPSILSLHESIQDNTSFIRY